MTDGIVEFPKVGSSVLCGVIGQDEDQCCVLKCSEVEKVVINGGQNGGLINIQTLVEQLDKTNEVIEAITGVLTGSPIPEPGNGAASALQAGFKGGFDQQKGRRLFKHGRQKSNALMPKDYARSGDFDLLIEGGDFKVVESTTAHQHDLLLAHAGEIRLYPYLGVGVPEYLNDDEGGGLHSQIREHFELDGMTVKALKMKAGRLQIDATYEA